MNQPPNFPQGYPPNNGQPPYQPGQTPPPGYPQNPQGYPQNYPPQGYQQPPQQQQPVKKKRTGLKIGCGAVTAIIVLAIIIGVASGGKSSTTPTTPSSSGGGSNTQQQQAPSAPQTWTTTHTYTGTGIKKTETITVPADWKIQWSCTPSSFMGNSYNIIIGVDNSDGSMVDPAAINAMCKDGNTSGETEERTAGNVYLDINSEGDWSINVQELK